MSFSIDTDTIRYLVSAFVLLLYGKCVRPLFQRKVEIKVMAKLKDFPYCSELRDNPDLADWECGPCLAKPADSDALERANFLHAYNVLETMGV